MHALRSSASESSTTEGVGPVALTLRLFFAAIAIAAVALLVFLALAA